MRRLLLLAAACLPLATALAQPAASTPTSRQACNPAPPDSAQVLDLGPVKTVLGPLAPFDPCHKLVKLDMPSPLAKKRGDKPPVVLIVHGGGGLGGYELDFARLMNQNGFATLVFDAFEINGLTRGSELLLYQMSNGARQRMIYKAAWGAYEWLLASDKVDTTRIFVQGLSNGGSVAINLAAATDPARVRAVLAEGGPSAGIGFPDEIRVPLLLLYGAADNYGGTQATDWMGERGGPCYLNEFDRLAPKGFAQSCNRAASGGAPGLRMPSPREWYQAQKERGADVRFEWVEGAGHGMLFAPFSASVVPQANGRQFHRSQGASEATRSRVQKLVLAFFESRL